MKKIFLVIFCTGASSVFLFSADKPGVGKARQIELKKLEKMSPECLPDKERLISEAKETLAFLKQFILESPLDGEKNK